MTIDPRVFAASLAETFHGPESRALTIHHGGQMTVADYHRLDLADDIEEITTIARVSTGACPDGVYECIGIDAGGWLVRAHFEPARWRHRFLAAKCAQYEALPYLRLVDDYTGFAHPDPFNDTEQDAAGGRVVDVPAPTSHPACGACNARRDGHDQPTT